MKKLISLFLACVLVCTLLVSCTVPNNTDTGTNTNTGTNETPNKDTNEPSNTDTNVSTNPNPEPPLDGGDSKPSQDEKKEIMPSEVYNQVDGGRFLGKIEETLSYTLAPYMIISSYDELLGLAENASSIDSSIFEENVILFIKQRFPHIGGENVGYSALKMIDGTPYISHYKYYYEHENCSELVVYYYDYILMPKAEIPSEMNKSGKIEIIKNNIFVNPPEHNNIELSDLLINTAIVLESKDEVDAFKDTYGLENYVYPYYSKVVILAIYIRRPERDNNKQDEEWGNVHQGYYYEIEGNTLKLCYLYDENAVGEMDTYVDFIMISKDVADEIDSIEIELKPRLEPAIKQGYVS